MISWYGDDDDNNYDYDNDDEDNYDDSDENDDDPGMEERQQHCLAAPTLMAEQTVWGICICICFTYLL